jgi:hypothetical protein
MDPVPADEVCEDSSCESLIPFHDDDPRRRSQGSAPAGRNHTIIKPVFKFDLLFVRNVKKKVQPLPSSDSSQIFPPLPTDNSAAKGQTDPIAWKGLLGVEPPEKVKNPLTVFGINSYSIVGDGKQPLALLPLGQDVNPWAYLLNGMARPPCFHDRVGGTPFRTCRGTLGNYPVSLSGQI